MFDVKEIRNINEVNALCDREGLNVDGTGMYGGGSEVKEALHMRVRWSECSEDAPACVECGLLSLSWHYGSELTWPRISFEGEQ